MGLPRYVNASNYDELPSIFKRLVVRIRDLKDASNEVTLSVKIAALEGEFCCWMMK